MAVFTEVSQDEAGELARKLDLGELRELRGIQGGIENTNYFLTTGKGEFVLIVRGSTDDGDAKLREGQRIYARLAGHLKPSVAAKLAAELSGAPRKALYGGEG